MALYISCYHWLPYDDQWWITGFVPNIYDYGVQESDLVHISSVDFEGSEGMLEALKNEYYGKDEGKALIFDMEDKKVWIIW